MKDIKISTMSVFLAFFLLCYPPPLAADDEVDCDAGDTIAERLDNLDPGDTLLVSGTCNENVRIREQLHDITLDGQGTAIINSPTGSNTIIVRGRGIVIKGFTITGGSTGILVQKGGAAGIIDNTIENNDRGIQVSEGSSARIGFDSVNDPVSPNRIRNNAREGIRVRRHASARIVGNTISGNRDGIVVREVSWAEITDNVINDNKRRGINVTGNSGVDLESNKTDVPGRQDVGIECTGNSYINGELGTLTGDPDGPLDASVSCDVDVD